MSSDDVLPTLWAAVLSSSSERGREGELGAFVMDGEMMSSTSFWLDVDKGARPFSHLFTVATSSRASFASHC